MDTSLSSSQFPRGREFYSEIKYLLSIKCFDVFQFSNMKIGVPPLCLTEMYLGPHATLDHSHISANNPYLFETPYLCRTLFLWVTPHIHRNLLQAAKPAFGMKALGRQEPSTPPPLSIWCFLQRAKRGLPRRTLKGKGKKKMSLGRAIPHCPGPHKACFFRRELANLPFVQWLL